VKQNFDPFQLQKQLDNQENWGKKIVKNKINLNTKESERVIERETAKSNRFDETRRGRRVAVGKIERTRGRKGKKGFFFFIGFSKTTRFVWGFLYFIFYYNMGILVTLTRKTTSFWVSRLF
jgi:hypothetical protein